MRNAIVSFSSDGIVTDIIEAADVDSQAGVEFYNGVLIPDLVNAHCHIELSYLKGTIPPGGGFIEFARQLGQVRGIYTEEERIAAASFQDAVLWRQGVVAVGDISNGATSFVVKSGSNIRYDSFLELYGLQCVDADSLMPLADMASTCKISYTVTPHSTYSLNKNAFSSAVAGFPGQERDLPLSIHFMESEAEKELYDGKGPMKAWYNERKMNTDFTGYGSPADRIVAQVPKDRNIMLIHNCFVTASDIDIIHNHFNGRVTWVLCPGSNDYISGIKPPVSLLRSKGATIAIGTDSLASNYSLDMVSEMRMIDGVPLTELVEWATINGSRALGDQNEALGFERGSRSGAVLISGLNWHNMSLTPESRSERIL